jgi:hypothetical protein
MMGYYGYGHMWGGGSNLLCLMIAIVVLVDLVLLGVWLWKQIQKK